MIINLTPHAVHIIGTSAREIPSSGIARVTEISDNIGTIDGISISRSVFGQVEGLPAPKPGVWLIVSTITAEAARTSGREMWDLLVPGTPVRDAAGKIIGVTSLRAVDPKEWASMVQANNIVAAVSHFYK